MVPTHSYLCLRLQTHPTSLRLYRLLSKTFAEEALGRATDPARWFRLVRYRSGRVHVALLLVRATEH